MNSLIYPLSHCVAQGNLLIIFRTLEFCWYKNILFVSPSRDIFLDSVMNFHYLPNYPAINPSLRINPWSGWQVTNSVNNGWVSIASISLFNKFARSVYKPITQERRRYTDLIEGFLFNLKLTVLGSGFKGYKMPISATLYSPYWKMRFNPLGEIRNWIRLRWSTMNRHRFGLLNREPWTLNR